MIESIKKHWFLVGIAVISVLAYSYPEIGIVLHKLNILNTGIVLAFFVTGLCLETSGVFRQIQGVKAPGAAVFSSLLLYPLLAWLGANALLPREFVVGVCILATGPVTVSSGTIMTAIAMGNIPLSLLICIATSLLCIFSIPFMLDNLLGMHGEIELPVLQMIGGLILKVLVPIIVGQVVRPWVRGAVLRADRQLSIFQSSIILLIICNAVSSSAHSIRLVGSEIIVVVIFVIGLHFFMVGTNYAIARLLRLNWPSLVAFTIHTSQKTLTITFIVWSGYFAVEYPSAFIPAIICQLTQMTAGTVLTQYLRQKSLSKN